MIAKVSRAPREETAMQQDTREQQTTSCILLIDFILWKNYKRLFAVLLCPASLLFFSGCSATLSNHSPDLSDRSIFRQLCIPTLLPSIITIISKRFPGHDELKMCRTSLVLPKQSALSILVLPSDAAFMTVT